MSPIELENAFKAAMSTPGGVLDKLTSMDKALEACCPGDGKPPSAPGTKPEDTAPAEDSTTDTSPEAASIKTKGSCDFFGGCFQRRHVTN